PPLSQQPQAALLELPARRGRAPCRAARVSRPRAVLDADLALRDRALALALAQLRLRLLQQTRSQRALRVQLDRPLQRRDRRTVVQEVELEAAELVPRPPIERLELDRLHVEPPRRSEVAQLLGSAGLEEHRLQGERIQRPR